MLREPTFFGHWPISGRRCIGPCLRRDTGCSRCRCRCGRTPVLRRCWGGEAFPLSLMKVLISILSGPVRSSVHRLDGNIRTVWRIDPKAKHSAAFPHCAESKVAAARLGALGQATPWELVALGEARTFVSDLAFAHEVNSGGRCARPHELCQSLPGASKWLVRREPAPSSVAKISIQKD